MAYRISLYIAPKPRVDLVHPDLLLECDEVQQMSEGGNSDRFSLSDTELLDALEMLLRHPDFYDLALSYDREEGRFYAGWEVGSDLREVLRTVLMRNRPAGLSLNTLLPSLVQQDKDTKKGTRDNDLRDGAPASGKSASASAGILLHRTES